MWIKTEKYMFMQGEPQLGYQYESELMYEDSEIHDAVEQFIKDEGYFPDYLYFIDDYTEEEIEIDTSDYVDKDDYKHLIPSEEE